jgi:hypothetical protein
MKSIVENEEIREALIAITPAVQFKSITLLFIICFLCSNASAQTKIRIKDFSQNYYAQVVKKPDSSTYNIQVYEKGTHKRLINATADQISDDLLEDEQLIPNIKELPYGNQSVLIYEDFNFDGVKDFAVMNGMNSCYGGPSFDIYLYINKVFVYNDAFSELSNQYCGMFQVDAKTKTLSTMTKDGCCWHQYSEYAVKNNKPVPIKIVEEDARGNSPYFVAVNTKEWTNGKKKETNELFMPYDNLDTVLSFKLTKNNKTVCLFSQDSALYYTLVRQDGSVEFYYPHPHYDEQSQTNIIDSIHYSETTIGFKNKDVYYEIYKEGSNIGIRLKMQDGSVINLEGDPSTLKGNINNLIITKNKNIII